MTNSEDDRQSLLNEMTDYLRLGSSEPILKLNEDAFGRIEEEYGRAGLAEIEKELANLNESGDRGEERWRMADTLEAGATVTVGERILGPDDSAAEDDNPITDTPGGRIAGECPPGRRRDSRGGV